jgi:predicted phage tail protein
MSITITSIKNPFEPEFNEIQVVDFVSGQTLGEYLPNLPIKDGIDFVFAVNGKEVDSDFVLSDGDLVAVCAKVEWSAATWVGSLAASAFNTGWAATAVYYGVSAVAFLAIGYGASVLVSALGPDTPELEDKGATNFGWETPKLSHFEGEPIPLIFGKVRTAGQIIQQFTSTYNGDNAEFENKEYLNLLVGVCNHEVDSITNMKINDQPVDSFTEVETHFRLGSINNTPIPGFGEIRHQNIVNIMQTTTAITRTTEGDAVQKILVDLVFPNGMYYIRGNGKLGTLGASYWVQYRRVFNDGTFGEWIEPYEGYPDALGSPDDPNLKAAVFVASTQDPIRRTIVIDNLEPGKYEIRSARVDDDDHQLSAQDDSYWDSFTEIIKEELSYPGMSLYSLSAMATDQLSGGMPNITVEVERKTVDVYDSNFGQWTKKPASNPAWICYALLNTYAGVPESRILYNEFGDWATYCDELVDGQCRFSCNTIVDGGNFWDNIQKIARIGRASVMHRGSKYGVFVDRSESVVSHMFTMGSILDGTFNLQYLPQIDRANYIELEYTDPDKEYSRQIVGLYDQAYLGENEQQPAKVSFEAAIPREQVIREGIFRINSNKHLNRVISFEAGVYSFACRVGDLFYFQHEIVDYESANTGGRIVSADTSSVVIDQTVTIQTGVVYKLLVEFMDGSFVERTVTSLAGTTDTLTVSQPWGTLPEQHCQYLFGEAETYKKAYRLTSCEFRDDYTRSIVGIEYIEDIYTDDSAIIEDLDRPGSIDIARAVNVKAHEALAYSSDGSLRSIVKLSWVPSNSNVSTNWQVWIKDITSEGPVLLVADNIRGTSYSIDSFSFLLGHEYKIAIINQGQALEDTGFNTVFITILGKLAPPADVTGFFGVWEKLHRIVHFEWNAVEDIDLDKYEIREGSNWDTAIKVAEAVGTSFDIITEEEDEASSKTYLIKALDDSGIYSLNAAITTVNINTESYVETILDILNGSITSAELDELLRTEIELISGESLESVNGRIAAAKTDILNSLGELEEHINSFEEYNPEKLYKKDELVKYNNFVYKNILAGKGFPPTDELHWKVIGNYSSLSDMLGDFSSAIEQINYIDANSESASARQLSLMSSKIDDPVTGLEKAHSKIGNEIATRISSDEALASQVNTIDVQFNRPTDGLSTQVAGLEAARGLMEHALSLKADADSVVVLDTEKFIAEIGNSSGFIDFINSISVFEGSVDISSSQEWVGMVNLIGNPNDPPNSGTMWGKINEAKEIALNADGSGSVQDLTELYAAIGSPSDPAGAPSTYGAIKALQNITLTPSQVESIARQVVITGGAGGNNAAIEALSQSVNGIKALRTIKVDVNGVVSGYGILSKLVDGQVTSSFGVNVDTFFVTHPGYSGKHKPFTIGRVNGVNTVGISGNLVVDGSVTSTKIAPNSVIVPQSDRGVSPVVGNGGWQSVASLYIHNPSQFQMNILGLFSARVGYSATPCTTGYHVRKNGSILVDFGSLGAVLDFPSFQFNDVIPPNGSANYEIYFFAANSRATMSVNRFLTIWGAIR